MFNIKIADLIVSIDNKYPFVMDRCADYITEEENNTGITLSVTEDRMQYSIDYKRQFDGEVISLPEAEFDAIHYKLYGKLHQFDAFWLHSVLIDKDGQGYAFTAKPGGGKSTHAILWLKTYNDATIINGDNTIIRRCKKDGVFYGYGTPFCGKEGYNANQRVPIRAVCFIEKSPANYVDKIKPLDAAMRMLKDNRCIRKSFAMDVMKLYFDMSEQVMFYLVHCNKEPDAAKTVYESISGRQGITNGKE